MGDFGRDTQLSLTYGRMYPVQPTKKYIPTCYLTGYTNC